MKLKRRILFGTFALPPFFVPAGANAEETSESKLDNTKRMAQESAKNPTEKTPSNVFRLGKITMAGEREDEQALGTSTINSEKKQYLMSLCVLFVR
jgi:zona occludens toxin (predicted ATPase)